MDIYEYVELIEDRQEELYDADLALEIQESK